MSDGRVKWTNTTLYNKTKQLNLQWHQRFNSHLMGRWFVETKRPNLWPEMTNEDLQAFHDWMLGWLNPPELLRSVFAILVPEKWPPDGDSHGQS